MIDPEEMERIARQAHMDQEEKLMQDVQVEVEDLNALVARATEQREKADSLNAVIAAMVPTLIGLCVSGWIILWIGPSFVSTAMSTLFATAMALVFFKSFYHLKKSHRLITKAQTGLEALQARMGQDGEAQ